METFSNLERGLYLLTAIMFDSFNIPIISKTPKLPTKEEVDLKVKIFKQAGIRGITKS